MIHVKLRDVLGVGSRTYRGTRTCWACQNCIKMRIQAWMCAHRQTACYGCFKLVGNRQFPSSEFKH